MTCPGLEPSPPRWEAGDLPPELWHDLNFDFLPPFIRIFVSIFSFFFIFSSVGYEYFMFIFSVFDIFWFKLCFFPCFGPKFNVSLPLSRRLLTSGVVTQGKWALHVLPKRQLAVQVFTGV
jgi:hypothetical protein